jgi:hypothetical protein
MTQVPSRCPGRCSKLSFAELKAIKALPMHVHLLYINAIMYATGTAFGQSRACTAVLLQLLASSRTWHTGRSQSIHCPHQSNWICKALLFDYMKRFILHSGSCAAYASPGCLPYIDEHFGRWKRQGTVRARTRKKNRIYVIILAFHVGGKSLFNFNCSWAGQVKHAVR